jgi:hypothetical protein
MAEEAENVGGISVDAGVNLGRVDADLESMLQKMEQAAKKAQEILSITPAVAQQQAPAARAPKPEESPAVRFGQFGKVAGGRLENLPADLQRQIDDALSREEAGLGRVEKAVASKRRERREEVVASAQSEATIQPTSVQIDAKEGEDAAQIIGALVVALRQLRDEASQPIQVKVDDAQPAEATQARRSPVRRRREPQEAIPVPEPNLAPPSATLDPQAPEGLSPEERQARRDAFRRAELESRRSNVTPERTATQRREEAQRRQELDLFLTRRSEV